MALLIKGVLKNVIHKDLKCNFNFKGRPGIVWFENSFVLRVFLLLNNRMNNINNKSLYCHIIYINKI